MSKTVFTEEIKRKLSDEVAADLKRITSDPLTLAAAAMVAPECARFVASIARQISAASGVDNDKLTGVVLYMMLAAFHKTEGMVNP